LNNSKLNGISLKIITIFSPSFTTPNLFLISFQNALKDLIVDKEVEIDVIEVENPSKKRKSTATTKAKSQNVDQIRIVLVHKIQNLKDDPELAKTLNIKVA
jgi:hypothetical protein